MRVPLPEAIGVSTERPTRHGARAGRRRGVLAATLVAGTAILAATLAAPRGSALFFGLGLLTAVTWIAGGLLAGPIQWTANGAHNATAVDFVVPILLGTTLFGAFFAAKLVTDHVPFLANSVHSVLARADAGHRIEALLVALVNGVGEEVFFRGALHDAFDRHRAVWATVIYCIVTIATLNLALVAAAVVMGIIFAIERGASRGVLAPILTHLTWSALVILFLPR